MLKSAATGVVLFLVGGFLAGCGGSVKVTDSWVDPNHEDQRVKSVMVLGVAKEATVRRLFEDHFVEELIANGVDAMVSYRVLSGELTKEMIDDAMADAQVDAIMVTRAVDQKKETVYTPGTTTVYGGYPGYYGSYYGYYSYGYSAVSTPGYVSEWVTFILESNLYDVASENLIWTARTELEEPGSVERAVDALSAVLTRDLRKHGLIGR